MSPFESLLWNVWLPRVRTTINNQWSPESPQKAIVFYEAWSSFLPLFIRDNILDQLILPKVQKAVANWNAKLSRVTLRAIVFPWLPYVGLRLEEVVGDARRKIKNLLRSWTVDESVPSDLSAWKDVSWPRRYFDHMNLDLTCCILGFRCHRVGHHFAQVHCSKTWGHSTQ